MKKLLLITLLLSGCVGMFAQTGIGTDNPNSNAALEIASATKGLLIPQLSLTATNAAAPMTAFVEGMLVYNKATAGVAPNNVVPGFYYSNGTQWLKFTAAATASDKNIYDSNGTVVANRTVTQNGNTLAFTSTATNGFSVDGTTLSVDAANNRVGFGTSSPSATLDVNGDARIRNLATGVVTESVLSIDATGNIHKVPQAEISQSYRIIAQGDATNSGLNEGVTAPINNYENIYSFGGAANSDMTSTGIWTAPKSGTYKVILSISGETTGGSMKADIWVGKNGSTISNLGCHGFAQLSTQGSISAQKIITVVAGDTLRGFMQGCLGCGATNWSGRFQYFEISEVK